MKQITGKTYICKPGTKQKLFTLRYIIFDPEKHFVNTDEAKEFWRKSDRIGKDKIKNEYLSIFAVSETVGKGRKKRIGFNKAVKTAANVIFIVPTKYRKEAYRAIQEIEIC